MSKPDVLAVLPGIIPSTLIGVVKPLIGLHRGGYIHSRFVLESSASPRDVLEADLVVFCRNVEPRYGWLPQLAQARGLPYIYVLDDDLFHVPDVSEVARYHHEPDRLLQLRRYVSGASLVSVFSSSLAADLREINPRINLLAGSVDFGLIRRRHPRPQRAPLKIVYATSRSRDHLAQLFLADLLRVLDDPKLQTEAYFWGYHPEALARHPRVHLISYTPDYDTFLRRFSRAGFDIGLAPLLDDAFHRSKSNNKFREYAASRVAGVYSNVEVYTRCVVNEVTGLIVPNVPGAWWEAIARLARDRSLREGIQDRAQRFAVEHYSMEAAQEAWWRQIQRVLADNRSRPQTVPTLREPVPSPGHAALPDHPQTSGPISAPGAWATLGSLLRRLRSTTPRRALATIRRRGSERWVLLKVQLATTPIVSLVDASRRRNK